MSKVMTGPRVVQEAEAYASMALIEFCQILQLIYMFEIVFTENLVLLLYALFLTVTTLQWCSRI